MYNPQGLQQYKQADISSMPKEKLVVLLYERLITDLRDSMDDAQKGDRLSMTRNLNHATRIISELRMALDHDIGGEIARNLDSLYNYAFTECLEQLVDQDPAHARHAIEILTPLLESWRQIPVGTAERAARDLANGTDPATQKNEETTQPVPAGTKAPVAEATSTVGSLSVSA